MAGTLNNFHLTNLRKILGKVNALGPSMKKKTDEELQAETGKLKERLKKGESLDALLPEAFAAIREASGRVLGMYPYDVQVLGAIALHQGKIAEMKTGEGKTLVATMPLYLNALTGKGCILVTMNNYLAIRDGKQLGVLYRFMGLTLEIGVPEDPGEQLENDQKRKIYSADIVYTTNSAFGFDYLLDNLASTLSKKYMRPFHYVIIDEADSVLLDSAHTPLVISGAPRVQSNLYDIADYFVTTLKEKRDYEQEDMSVWLTEEGVRRAEQFFCTDNLFSKENFERMRHILLALRAHVIFEKDKQFIVDDDKVKLLDEKSGRILENTKLRAGQHQALESMVHVKITMENRSMAAISYQDLFNMFPKVAGMTGSGSHDRAEFKEIYHLDVVEIPTRKKLRRIDYPDRVFSSMRAQVYAALEEVKALHEKKQPILLIADSIAMSDIFSSLLLQEGIPHNVLNAYNTAKEADIIKEAGQAGAVTVATAVAGRGTDIQLGEGVEEIGGLAVLGISRMDNKRLEIQARGRAGRQGDPGFSRFYVSFDDEVVVDHGPKWLERFRNEDVEVFSHRLRRAVRKAQRVSEDQGREARKSTMQYAESMRSQRELIYATRDNILNAKEISLNFLLRTEGQVIDAFLEKEGGNLDAYALSRFVLDNISYRMDEFPDESVCRSKQSARDYLMGIVKKTLDAQFSFIKRKESIRAFCQQMMLKAIDEAWIEQVDYVQQLRAVTSGRQYAQRNVMHEYHIEAYRSFMKMEKQIRSMMMRNILLGELSRDEEGKLKVLAP